MDYNNINDDELIMMIRESNEEAKDIMYAKYRFIVNYMVKKYKNLAYKLSVDIKDLNQEALVGFSDALINYNSDSNASLKTFISLCVERRIKAYLVKASRKKNTMLNEALSLEHEYSDFNSTLADIISDHNENNPLTKMTRDERYNELISSLYKELSQNEKDVFSLMLEGLNYNDIASILNMNVKSVDNAIQRIKNKVRNTLLVEE